MAVFLGYSNSILARNKRERVGCMYLGVLGDMGLLALNLAILLTTSIPNFPKYVWVLWRVLQYIC